MTHYNQPSEFPPEYWLDPTFDLRPFERGMAARATAESWGWSLPMLTLIMRSFVGTGILEPEREALIEAFGSHLDSGQMLQLTAIVDQCPTVNDLLSD